MLSLGHALCLNDARKAVRTVLLVAARLVHDSDRQPQQQPQQQQQRSRRVAFKTQQKVLPDPDELWFCIFSLIPRHTV